MKSRREFLAAASFVGSGVLLDAGSPFEALDRLQRAASGAIGDYLLAPGLAYLNTASTGPSTKAVLESTIAAWRELEKNPVQQAYDPVGVSGAAEKVRTQAAAFLGCSADELLITRSTSEAMNTVAQSMRLNAGDRVLSSNQEHEGGTNCWEYLAERRAVVLDTVSITREMDDRAVVASFAAGIRKETKVISVSHVLWTTGRKMPVAEIAALSRDRGLLCVVDGAQAVGSMPVDVKAIGCHAYATSGHKWLMGPKGVGLLYISADCGDAVKPVQWIGGKRYVGPSVGVGPLVLVIGLGAAMEAASARGLADIERHNLALRNRAYAGLTQIKQVRLMSAESGPSISALVAFELPSAVDVRTLMQTLTAKYSVQVKSFARPFNGMRLSPHVFNTEGDVDRALSALRAEVA